MSSSIILAVLLTALSPGDPPVEAAAEPAADSQAPTEPSVSERIARGRQLMEEIYYEPAAEELMLAIGDPRATKEELVEANLLAGIANRVMQHNVEARLNFHYVLTRAPETTLPEGTPPRIATFFELVRREVEAERELRAPAAPPTEAPTPVVAEAPPAETSERGGLPIALIAGGVLAGISAAAASGLLVVALGSEVWVRDPTLPWEQKLIGFYVGQAALVGISVPVIGLLAGGGLVAFGVLE